jgi:hypothetical protein
MKKVLYVNGCSHCAGSEITQAGHWHKETDENQTFGKMLADKWRYDYINDAVPGQGNKAIVSQTIHRLYSLLETYNAEDIFVIIGWAGPERSHLVYKGEWWRFCAGLNPKVDKFVMQAFNNWVITREWDVAMNEFSLDYLNIVNFLESQDIKYCMFNSSIGSGIIPIPEENHLHCYIDKKSTKKIFDNIANNPAGFHLLDSGWEFYHYLADQGFDGKFQGRNHHMPPAHQHWADLLDKFVEENNLKG